MECSKVIQGQLGGAPTVTKRSRSRTSITARNAGASVKRSTEPKSERSDQPRWWVHLLDETDRSLIVDSRAFSRKKDARQFYYGAVRVYGDHRVMCSAKKLAAYRRRMAPPNASLTAVS
jgi:hypothetical protein